MSTPKSLLFAFLLAMTALQPVAGAPHQAQAARSPDEAAAAARRQTGGRVLGVEWSEGGSGPVYLVKVLMPNGSIRIVPVTAEHGR